MITNGFLYIAALIFIAALLICLPRIFKGKVAQNIFKFAPSIADGRRTAPLHVGYFRRFSVCPRCLADARLPRPHEKSLENFSACSAIGTIC